MKETISKELVKKWEDSNKITASLEKQISNRVGYIISVWVEAFGGKLTNWWFDGYDEQEDGLSGHISHDSIYSLHIECWPEPKSNDKYDMVILTKDGDEWGWDGSFPLRWLFEDCEEEITKGKELYDKLILKKKEDAAVKKSLKKKIDSALAEQAKAKLSKEELAALRKSL